MPAQSCPTVTLWTVAHQAPLSMGFPRQEHWSRLPFPPPGNLSNSKIEPTSPASSAVAGGFFATEPPGKPPKSIICQYKIFLNTINFSKKKATMSYHRIPVRKLIIKKSINNKCWRW